MNAVDSREFLQRPAHARLSRITFRTEYGEFPAVRFVKYDRSRQAEVQKIERSCILLARQGVASADVRAAALFISGA